MEEKKTYSVREYKGNSLWLADDATLIANTKKRAKGIIEALITVGGGYGLNLNKEKTKNIQVRGTKIKK